MPSQGRGGRGNSRHSSDSSGRGARNNNTNIRTRYQKKPQNIRELKDIHFTIASDSRSSDVEEKMKRFIELLKAEEQFGEYRHQIGLALEDNQPDTSHILVRPTMGDDRYKVMATTKEEKARERTIMDEMFKEDLKDHRKEEKRLQQSLQLGANNMLIACNDLLKERLET